MPWKETQMLDQRVHFITDFHRRDVSFAALCRQYGISRETGYKYVRQYAAEGPAGLHERSRAPKTHPQAMPLEIETKILHLREKHPTWGPVKLRQHLVTEEPVLIWPAPSTIGDLLHRKGLCHRRRRRAAPHATPSPTLTTPERPNHVWCIDFKGQYALGNQQLCYPLPLTDAECRFLLRCQAHRSTEGRLVFPVMEAAFREYGLPERIRSDNGPPFASTGLGGISRLALWWLKLGIRPERIGPGRPDQNGRHERFHRTLKEDLQLATAPVADFRAQDRQFLQYRHEYNTLRPHAALDGKTPAQVYTPSPRPYPAVIPAFVYPDEYHVRLIHTNGYVKWKGHPLYISEALIGEYVGIKPITDRHWILRVGVLPLAIRDEAEQRWLTRTEANHLLPLCEEEIIE